MRVAGQAWTAGIGARSGQVSQADAPVVASLREAGAALLSRLAMDEGALGAATDNAHFGRCGNPALPGHSPGGSSGGSAAAVAAGVVDAALGSDTMGSVRIPAAYCGVFALKLSHGAVPMDGVFPLAPSLDALGIFARTPSVVAEVLDVLCPISTVPTRISGWLEARPADLATCAPEIQSFYGACCAALARHLGAPAMLPKLDLASLRSAAFLLTEVEAAKTLGNEPGLSKGLMRLLDYGRGVDPAKRVRAQQSMTEAADLLQDAMSTGRVILLPTVAEPAFEHGSRPPVGQADFTVLANIAGCPAIAIPKPDAQPPVSVQVIGPKGSETALTELAQEIAAYL